MSVLFGWITECWKSLIPFSTLKDSGVVHVKTPQTLPVIYPRPSLEFSLGQNVFDHPKKERADWKRFWLYHECYDCSWLPENKDSELRKPSLYPTGWQADVNLWLGQSISNTLALPRLVLVHSGQYISKVVQGKNVENNAIGWWIPTASRCTCEGSNRLASAATNATKQAYTSLHRNMWAYAYMYIESTLKCVGYQSGRGSVGCSLQTRETPGCPTPAVTGFRGSTANT